MKILLWSDSPFLPTGQGRVMLELGRRLQKDGHVVKSLAWRLGNARDEVIKPEWPVIFIPGECYRVSNVEMLVNILKEENADVCLALGDVFHFWGFQCVKDELRKLGIKTFFHLYVNVDGENYPPKYRAVVQSFNGVTCTSNFASEQMKRITGKSYPVAWHGVNSSVFCPVKFENNQPCDLSNVFSQTFGSWKDYFIATFVGRNASRKSLHVFMEAISKIQHTCPKFRALFVTNPIDNCGYPLQELASAMRVDYDRIGYILTSVDTPISEFKLNAIYNQSTVLVNCSLGEGFGLPLLEAMAAGTPVVGVDNSAVSELLKGRGILVDADETWWSGQASKHPYSSPGKFVSALEHLYRDWENGSREIEKLRYESRKFAEEQTWDKTAQKIYSDIEEELKNFGRNFVSSDNGNSLIDEPNGVIEPGIQSAICNVTRDSLDREQVYVIKMGGLGDLVQLTPVLRGIREKHKEAAIYVFTEGEDSCKVLDGNPDIDEVIALGKLSQNSLVKSCIPLSSHTYDVRYVSREYGNEGRSYGKGQSWFYKNWPLSNARIESIGKHVIDLMIESLGLSEYTHRENFFVPVAPSVECKLPDKYVVIHNHVGNVGDLKTWDTNKIKEIISWFRSKEYSIVQMGNGGDLFDNKVIDLRNTLSMSEMSYVLRKASLYFGVEGGLFHLSKAVGTPGAVYFSITPIKTFAYDDTIVLSKSACPPCWWRGGDWHTYCPLDYEQCINFPEVEEVISALEIWHSSNLAKKESAGGYIKWHENQIQTTLI